MHHLPELQAGQQVHDDQQAAAKQEDVEHEANEHGDEQGYPDHAALMTGNSLEHPFHPTENENGDQGTRGGAEFEVPEAYGTPGGMGLGSELMFYLKFIILFLCIYLFIYLVIYFNLFI